ncbi:MAG TPA: YwiC-like family protein [Kofleriaceae bacterium]|nr:YwiC-like family protein [Kofleriaceae bacterium]
MPPAGSRVRSLWPREHGAYVQLLAPLATAMVATRPTIAGAAIAAGACLAFLASEPLRVLLGARGARLQETAGGPEIAASPRGGR